MSRAHEERFRAVYRDAYRPVLAYAMRRVTTPADAHDAVAEVFLTAWRRLEDVPDPALPWLYGVARKVVANQRRAGQRRHRLSERLSHLPPDEAVELAPLLDDGQLARSLAALKPIDREILRLSAWEDLAHAEIGMALGCSTKAVAVRLHRARRRLGAELARRKRRSEFTGPRHRPQGPARHVLRQATDGDR